MLSSSTVSFTRFDLRIITRAHSPPVFSARSVVKFSERETFSAVISLTPHKSKVVNGVDADINIDGHKSKQNKPMIIIFIATLFMTSLKGKKIQK